MNGPRLTALYGIAGATLLLMMGWSRLIAWADLNPNMAAWVQAIGSLGAILATAIFFIAQGSREKRAGIQRAADEKADQAKVALAVLHLVLRTLNAFERYYRPVYGHTWASHYEPLDDACDLLRETAMIPMFAEARAELLHVREAMLVISRISRQTVGHVAGGNRSDLFLKIARGRIVESKAAIAAATPFYPDMR
jgi:hypothetical protein